VIAIETLRKYLLPLSRGRYQIAPLAFDLCRKRAFDANGPHAVPTPWPFKDAIALKDFGVDVEQPYALHGVSRARHKRRHKPCQLLGRQKNGEKNGDVSVISRRGGRLAQNGGEGGKHHCNNQGR
jgi:hypothetical protein